MHKFLNKIFLPAFFALLISGCKQKEENKESPETVVATEPVNQPSPNKAVDKTVLTGDWIRTDAGYRVQISELLDNGTMKAGYFNPQSIHVGKAMWTSENGMLRVYIELRDVNYPGSNYQLVYIPEKDLLAGKYFQAVEGVTYDVAFGRKR